jgi:hypothetical protein
MKKIRLFIIILPVFSLLFTSCKKDTVPNTPIAVNAGLFQTIQLPDDSATLTGVVTSGQSPTLIYSWTLISGPSTPIITNSNTTIAKVNNLIAGTYIFQFEATNSSGTVIGLDTTAIVVTPVPPIASKIQLLTQHVWEFQKTLIQVGNTQTEYIRDSINTTGDDYDVSTFTYNTNGTGTILDGSGNTNTFTWAFNPSDSTTMTLVINYATPITFTFSFIRLTQNSYTYTESYTQGGVNILTQVRLIPVTLSKIQLLTQHVWEVQKTIVQIGNTQTEYIRDSINTTGDDYDASRFTYNTNGTGTVLDGAGNTNTFTWAFNPSDSSTMILLINYATPITFTFSFIRLTQNSYTYTESYTNNGYDILAELNLIPAS